MEKLSSRTLFEALMVKWVNQRGGSNALDIAGQIKAIQSSSNASKQNWCDDLEKISNSLTMVDFVILLHAHG